MGTNGDTFAQHIHLFSQLPNIRALTCHYLDTQLCPLATLAAISPLTKLELVVR